MYLVLRRFYNTVIILYYKIKRTTLIYCINLIHDNNKSIDFFQPFVPVIISLFYCVHELLQALYFLFIYKPPAPR